MWAQAGLGQARTEGSPGQGGLSLRMLFEPAVMRFEHLIMNFSLLLLQVGRNSVCLSWLRSALPAVAMQITKVPLSFLIPLIFFTIDWFSIPIQFDYWPFVDVKFCKNHSSLSLPKLFLSQSAAFTDSSFIGQLPADKVTPADQWAASPKIHCIELSQLQRHKKVRKKFAWLNISSRSSWQEF